MAECLVIQPWWWWWWWGIIPKFNLCIGCLGASPNYLISLKECLLLLLSCVRCRTNEFRGYHVPILLTQQGGFRYEKMDHRGA